MDNGGGRWTEPGFYTDLMDSLNVSVDQKQRNAVSLFPNPARGQVTITSDYHLENYILRMYNLEGQLIKELQLTSQGVQRIDVSGLPPAVYVFKIQSSKGIENFNLVVQ
jgi:hypothetical protein